MCWHDVLNTKQPEAISLRFNTKIIDAIETDKLYYISSDDGAFNTGECLEKTTRKPVALTKCKPLYDDAQEKLKVSEIAVRGNIIPLLNNR